MTAQTRDPKPKAGPTLDLRRGGRGPAPTPPPPIAKDTGEKMRERQAAMLAAAAQGAVVEAPPEAAPAPVKPLCERQMGFAVKYKNPDTGEFTTVEIVSRVPDELEVEAIHADIRRRLRNSPWDSVPEWMKLRAMALATCWVQIKQAPDWFIERLGEDGVLLFDTYGRLAEHSATYFPGNEGTGAPGTAQPRVVVGPLTPLPAPLLGRNT